MDGWLREGDKENMGKRGTVEVPRFLVSAPPILNMSQLLLSFCCDL